MPPETIRDCLVVGAGPAGSAAALEMARAGLDVLVIDRGEFPRFRIGESFLPRTKRAFRRLGVLDRCLALPHARKVGVEITLGDWRHGPQRYFFRDVYGDGEVRVHRVGGGGGPPDPDFLLRRRHAHHPGFEPGLFPRESHQRFPDHVSPDLVVEGPRGPDAPAE